MRWTQADTNMEAHARPTALAHFLAIDDDPRFGKRLPISRQADFGSRPSPRPRNAEVPRPRSGRSRRAGPQAAGRGRNGAGASITRRVGDPDHHAQRSQRRGRPGDGLELGADDYLTKPFSRGAARAHPRLAAPPRLKRTRPAGGRSCLPFRRWELNLNTRRLLNVTGKRAGFPTTSSVFSLSPGGTSRPSRTQLSLSRLPTTTSTTDRIDTQICACGASSRPNRDTALHSHGAGAGTVQRPSNDLLTKIAGYRPKEGLPPKPLRDSRILASPLLSASLLVCTE